MIEIPVRFKEKLEKDHDYNTIVMDVIRLFSPIIRENRLEFFPEYTDHGFLHINRTLEIANRLIPNETFDELNSLDIGMIILSIFIHDLGMHITYEFFIQLINGTPNIDNSTDNKEWNTLWDEYFSEAKLWSVKKLKAIFNEDIMIRQVPITRGDATENDKKLVGEFIRRHHPRLAYEISIFGFLQIDGSRMEITSALDYKLKKLLGFITRSHGMNLWDAIPFIENEFGREQIRAPKSIHAIYIMVVLRLSDYLDMDKSRANTAILKFRKINSSISETEWQKHNVVDYIAMDYQDDPESIYVYINELTRSKIYLAINDLLKKMQNELDTCWAVLGKVYGAFENLKLSFRRIHSNIYNKDLFLKNINFIPERIRFDSNPDILKLLIQPLYGNNPAYGVRELLQNAVDACIEIKEIQTQKYEPNIIITISEELNCFVIEDNGIGMNKDILINYFLVAGASFRNNDAWKKAYCYDNKSTVPRSGRFGVGVFASFLLGSEISVETSRFGEGIGYKFNANIDTDQIEVLKENVDKNTSGTKIRINIDKYTMGVLKNQYTGKENQVTWNQWYYAYEPKLIINVPNDWGKRYGKHNVKVSLYNNKIDSYWKSINPDGYHRVDWTYKDVNKLICNGILIPDGYSIYDFRRYNFPDEFTLPAISIVDYDANLPLNLDRNGISNKKVPFETELLEDIYNDIIHKLLIIKDISELHDNKIIIRNTKLIHPAIKEKLFQYTGMESSDLLLTKKGFNICNGYILKRLRTRLINKIWLNSDVVEINDSDLTSKIDQLIISNNKLSSIYDFKTCLDWNNRTFNRFNFENIRAYIKKENYKYIFEKGKKRMRSCFERNINIESENNNWYCITYGSVPKSTLNIDYFERNSNDINLFVEYYYQSNPSSNYNSTYKDVDINLFELAMTKHISEDIYIPYDINTRMEKYSAVLED